MTIKLSDELEKMIQQKVESGAYPSAQAIVREAIENLLRDNEGFAPGELDAMLKVGTDELDRGDVFDGSEVFEQMRRTSAAIRAGQKP